MNRIHCRFLYSHIKRYSSSDTTSILTTRKIQPSYDAVVIGGGKSFLYVNLSTLATKSFLFAGHNGLVAVSIL